MLTRLKAARDAVARPSSQRHLSEVCANLRHLNDRGESARVTGDVHDGLDARAASARGAGPMADLFRVRARRRGPRADVLRGQLEARAEDLNATTTALPRSLHHEAQVSVDTAVCMVCRSATARPGHYR